MQIEGGGRKSRRVGSKIITSDGAMGLLERVVSQ